MNTEGTDERMGLPSASGINRVVLCPGSHNLEAKAIEPPESHWAARGTRIHGVMDGSVSREELSSEELAVVAELEEYDKLLFHDTKDVTREVRYWYEDKGKKIWSGKLDIAARCALTGKGIVCNYKTGRGQDSVRNNWQAKAEAVLWWMQWRDQGMEEVRYCFAQPESVYDTVLCHTFTKPELQRAENEIRQYVTLALSGEGWLEPSESACKWCDAKTICPALQYKINAYADIHITSEEFNEMSPVQRGHHIKRAKEARDAAASIYDALTDKTKDLLNNDPESISGWYMAKGREITSITSVKVAKQMAENLGIPEDEFYASCNISTSAMQKLAAKHLKVKDPKQWVRDNFAPVIRSTNARASLKSRKS